MLYAIIAAIAVLLLLYLMPITVIIEVNKNNKDDNIIIGIKTMYGLVKLKTEVPFLIIKFVDGKPVLKYKLEVANKNRSKLLARFTKLLSLTEGEGLYEAYRKNKDKIKPVMKYITAKASINDFNLKLCLGTGDAAATGILYGAACIIIGNIMTFTRSFLNVKNPRVIIIPIFSKVQLLLDFSCIISLKLGHIINAGIRLIRVLLSKKA